MFRLPGLETTWTSLFSNRYRVTPQSCSSAGLRMISSPAETFPGCIFQCAKRLDASTVISRRTNSQKWCGRRWSRTHRKRTTSSRRWNFRERSWTSFWRCSLIFRSRIHWIWIDMICWRRLLADGCKRIRWNGRIGCPTTCLARHRSTWVECFRSRGLTGDNLA